MIALVEKNNDYLGTRIKYCPSRILKPILKLIIMCRYVQHVINVITFP